MTRPRQVLPGRTVMLTRRCSERRFFLKTDDQVTQLFEYLLAVGAQRFGLLLVASVCLYNHWHQILHDPNGRWPEFAQWFDSLLARAMNCYRSRSDAFWSADQLHVVELADREAQIDAIAYVLANPTAAGLVEHGRDWPGVRSRPQDFTAEPRRIERPTFFFTAKSELPATAELTYHVPPGHEHLEPAEFVNLVANRVGHVEAEHRARMAKAGRRFVGPRGLKKQRWQSRPRSRELRGRRYRIRPEVKASTRAIRRGVLARLADFRRDYAAALDAWRDGDRLAVFPAGTWLLRRRHRVACWPPP